MGVAAARASTEPVPPSMAMAKTESKAVSAVGKTDPRPVQPSVVATKAETRATNLPGEAERPSILLRGSCLRKSGNAVEVRGSPPKAARSVRGTSPPKTVLSARGSSPPKALNFVLPTTLFVKVLVGISPFDHLQKVNQ